jgi:hypothetical protein
VIKVRIRWTGHVASNRTDEKNNLNGRDQLGDSEEERIILKLILKESAGRS